MTKELAIDGINAEIEWCKRKIAYYQDVHSDIGNRFLQQYLNKLDGLMTALAFVNGIDE